ncbi:unnamed protein product, partial [Owenia fusiformis]
MAEKKARPRLVNLTESEKKRRRVEQRRRSDAAIIHLGESFNKWCEIRDKLDLKNAELAKLLLKVYCESEKKIVKSRQTSDTSSSDQISVSSGSYEAQKSEKHTARFNNRNYISSALRKDTKYADMIFIIKDGAEVTAHKTILSLFSEALQENEVRKCFNPILSDATQCGLDGFLDLIYGLGVTLSHEN